MRVQDPRQEAKVSMAEKDPEHSPVSKDDWPTSPLFDDGAFYDELYHDNEAFRRQSGLTLFHPFFMILIFLGALTIAWKTYPNAVFYFAEPSDCGVLADRVVKRAKGEAIPEFEDDKYCTLEATIQSRVALMTRTEGGGQPYEDGKEPTVEELEGVLYYALLNGDNVVGILPADGQRIHRYRNFQGDLSGFTFQAPGRLTRLRNHPDHQKTENALRLEYSIPDDQDIWLFDVVTRPQDQLMYLVVTASMGVLAFFALVGFRIARRRR